MDNEARDPIIVALRQSKDGRDPMGEEEIARTMGTGKFIRG